MRAEQLSDVRCAPEGTVLQEVLGFPPTTVSKLNHPARLALDTGWMEGPLHRGGFHRLVSWMVETVNVRELAHSLEDVDRIFGLVVPDDGVEVGGAAELEDKEWFGLWCRLASARGAHIAGGRRRRGGGGGGGGEGKAGFGKGGEEGRGKPTGASSRQRT